MVVRVPDEAAGPGGSDGSPDALPLRAGPARQGWRGWAGDLAVALRRGWRAAAAVLLVTMALPVLPLSGLIADGATAGAAVTSEGKVSGITLAVAVIVAPFLLVLAAACGLAVARGWTGAVWAVASAGPGRPAGLRDALAWSRHRSGMLWGSYMIGVAVLTGVAFLTGYLAPGASTVPNLLALAGPVGVLAPVLAFVLLAVFGWQVPSTGDPLVAGRAPVAGCYACLAPMALMLAVVASCEVAVALALSWLMTPASAAVTGMSMGGPAAAIIASPVALPGSVLLAAANSVSYARCRDKPRR